MMVLALTALTLAGCVPASDPAASISPTPSLSSSGAHEATPTASAAPQADSTAPNPVPVPETKWPDTGSDGNMSAAQAAESCLRSYATEMGEASRTLLGVPQVYARSVDPVWLVLIPRANEPSTIYVECFIGGPYSDGFTYAFGEMVASTVTPEYIQWATNENGGL